MSKTLQAIREENARLRTKLRSYGLTDADLAFAASDDSDSLLPNHLKLLYCVEQYERLGYDRPANPTDNVMNTTFNARQTVLNDELAKNKGLNATLRPIGKDRPSPALTGDTEKDIVKVQAENADLSASVIAFAQAIGSVSHASALAGRAPTGPTAGEAGKGGVTAAAQEALTALASLSPAQAQLYSEYLAVEKNPTERSKFIREHEKDLISLTRAIDACESVAQAAAAPSDGAAAQSGAASAPEDDELIKQYKAVEKDPVRLSAFMGEHAS
jgi:hypothetical protein